MWALLYVLFYGTFVVCIETWLESRAKKRARTTKRPVNLPD